MADSVRITIEADDRTASGIASAVANLGKLEKASEKVSGSKGGGTGVRGLGAALGGLNSALSGIGIPALGWTAAIGGAVAIAKNAITTTSRYTEEVRDLSFVTGTGAESTSRLLQVLDDYQIGAQDVEVATKALTKNGLAPTVETLAKLSEEYLQITDAQERNEFVLKNLGKAGLNWVNFLSQGEDAILALNDGVNKNLILTEEEIARYERYRLAMDNIKDTMDGWKVSAVNSFLDASEAYTTYEDKIRMGAELAQRFGTTTEATRHSQALYNEELERLANEYIRAETYGKAWERTLNGTANTAVEASVDYAELLKNGQAITKMNASMEESQQKIKTQFEDNAFVTELFKTRVGELKDQLQDGEITNQEYYQSVAQLQQAYRDGTFAAEEQARALSELESSVDKSAQAFALSQLEITGATERQKVEFALANGLITSQAADQAKAQIKLAEAYTAGRINAEQYAAAVNKVSGDLQSLNGQSAESYVDVFIRYHGKMPGFVTGLHEQDENMEGPLAGGRAGGGMMFSDRPTLVGDMPGGRLTPYSELLLPSGEILDARTTRALFETGLLGGVESAAAGTGASIADRIKRGGLRRPAVRQSTVKTQAILTAPAVEETMIPAGGAAVSPDIASVVRAYTESAHGMTEKLDVIAGLLSKQATRQDEYNSSLYGSRVNING